MIRPTRSPSTPSSSTERSSGAGRGIEVESAGSWPPITSSATAASATEVANGPIWSRLEAKAISPMRLTTPYVGFTPTTPHSAAGWRIDPPVSLPKPRVAKPAATAAALPPLEPPGTRLVSSGLRVGPNAEFSVLEPMANSSRLVLPTITAPAARSRVTTVASYGGFHPSRMRDEHVVGMPRVQRLSFKATGTPASGPGSSPATTLASTAAAASCASSTSTRLKAWISSSRLAMAARCSSSTSTALRSPARTAAAISIALGFTLPTRRSAGP